MLFDVTANGTAVPSVLPSVMVDATFCPPCAAVNWPKPSGMLIVSNGAVVLTFTVTGIVSVDGFDPLAGYVTVIEPEHVPGVMVAVAAFTVIVAGAELETEFEGVVAVSQPAGQLAAEVIEVANAKVIGWPFAVSCTNCAVGAGRVVSALNTIRGGPALRVVVLPTVRFTVIGSE